MRAINDGNLELVTRLVEQLGADVNQIRYIDEVVEVTPLSVSIRENKFEIAAYLLQHGAGLGNFNDPSLLIRAIKHRNLQMVKLLVSYGIRLRQKYLRIRLRQKYLEKLDKLLLIDLPPNQVCRHWSALHICSFLNRCKAAKNLIAKGFNNFNLPTAEGFTALHLACSRGHSAMLRLLLNAMAEKDNIDIQAVKKGANEFS